MNLINVILFCFCLAVTGSTSLNDYYSQLQKKPRYKRVVPNDSAENRRLDFLDPHASAMWPIYQKGLDIGVNSGHKAMSSILRSKRLYRHPAYRSKNDVGMKFNRYRPPPNQIKRTDTLPQHLHHPPAEPNVDPHIPSMGGLHPGHTLLKPKGRTLESAANYPKDNTEHLVYGNPAHFGITYNKTRSRVIYSDFRRLNDEEVVENTVLQAILKLRQYQEQAGGSSNGLIVIGIEPPNKNEIKDGSNEATEVMDLRRSKKRAQDHEKLDRKGRYKEDSRSSREDSSSSSSESDYDKNPGNPYTIHKNRYHQNWLWNHFMDGDHMNIDPYGPKVGAIGPSGIDLFFGRKWWYFNQDDYKPLG